MKFFRLVLFLSFINHVLYSQTNTQTQIKETLLNYINGTSFNDPELIEEAFYEEAKLYLDKPDDPLFIVHNKEYTSWFKKGEKGKFNGREGRIISIDYFNNIAVAKVEILFPAKQLKYVDMFLLKKLNNGWKIICKSATGEKSNLLGDRVLFVVSNAQYYGDSKIATGNSISEIVNAYDVFLNAGYNVDFVSPDGGSIPLIYINTSDELQKKYLYDADFIYALKYTKSPKDIQPEHYKAVYYVGGGSAMFGVPENKDIQRLTMAIYEDHNGIVSSVCHGTAGIVNLKTKDGKYLVSGKVVSGYPDSYEKKEADYFKEFPFLIQQTIEGRGGVFKFSPKRSIHIEVDDKVITGQNHLSSKGVAEKVIERLKKDAM